MRRFYLGGRFFPQAGVPFYSCPWAFALAAPAPKRSSHELCLE